jgi:hypothetical protein
VLVSSTIVAQPALNSCSLLLTPICVASVFGQQRSRSSATNFTGIEQCGSVFRNTAGAEWDNLTEETNMLWTIFVVLLVLWLLGFSLHVAGGLIHLLLVVALVVLVINLLSGRSSAV